MFRVKEITQNWFTKSVTLEALDEIEVDIRDKHLYFKDGDTFTVNFPIRYPVEPNEMIGEDILTELDSLIPSRFRVV